jgi:hypothetical protein
MRTYLQPDQSGAPAEPAQPPSKNSEAAAARTAAQGRGRHSHGGDGSRSAWASSLPTRLPGACPAPLALSACSLCCSLRISLKQVADRIEPIRGNGQKCHRAVLPSMFSEKRSLGGLAGRRLVFFWKNYRRLVLSVRIYLFLLVFVSLGSTMSSFGCCEANIGTWNCAVMTWLLIS